MQLSKNRILIEDGPVCQVTSATAERKSRTNLAINKKRQITMKHNSFTDDGIPIFIVFKAMGFTSESEIVEIICGAPHGKVDVNYLIPSLDACEQADVWTDNQALEYMAKKLKNKSSGKPGYSQHRSISPVDLVRELLATTIVAHVPVVNTNFRLKAIYIGQMVRRLILAVDRPEFIDDRDYYGNKRLELAGSLVGLLFEDLLKRFNSELRQIADKNIPKIKAAQFDISKHMRQDLITNGLINCIATGNWTLKRFKMERIGVSQVLSRLSYISALGMMTRINSQFEKTRKTSGPRSLQCSQWGLICPCDTPEGESCGLIKNLALMSHITTDVDDNEIIDFCLNFGYVQDIHLCESGSKINDYPLVYVNGIIIGITLDLEKLVKRIRSLRQMGRISEFVSVSYNLLHNAVYIATDGGRLCRPYIIVDTLTGTPKLTETHLKKLERKFM